jgi:hypothetical protein
LENVTMTRPSQHGRPSGNPTEWTVAARRWTLKNSEQELATGEDIETVGAPDRELAIVIAHHLLDKHAHEAFGTVSLEIHVMPPQRAPKEPSGFRHYKISPEARKQAQTLGIRGEVEAKVARMARLAAPFTHPMANRRFERFIMHVEKDTVTWIGINDAGSSQQKR